MLENFASLIIQKKDKRTGGASFIEFATSLAYKHRLKLPNGIEAYFAKKHPKVYEDFDIPFNKEGYDSIFSKKSSRQNSV